MKTTEKNTKALNIETLKKLALMQHNQEEFFLIETEDGTKAFEGNEEELRAEFEESIQNTEEEPIDVNFIIWLENNGKEAQEYNADDYNNDYLVLTDEEADEKVKTYILDTVWAFTPSFLSSETGIDAEVFQAIQNNGRCESNNNAILSMIKNEDDFVKSAISADGRGHFLSYYDGEENEEVVQGEIFYIYRIN